MNKFEKTNTDQKQKGDNAGDWKSPTLLFWLSLPWLCWTLLALSRCDPGAQLHAPWPPWTNPPPLHWSSSSWEARRSAAHCARIPPQKTCQCVNIAEVSAIGATFSKHMQEEPCDQLVSSPVTSSESVSKWISFALLSFYVLRAAEEEEEDCAAGWDERKGATEWDNVPAHRSSKSLIHRHVFRYNLQPPFFFVNYQPTCSTCFSHNRRLSLDGVHSHSVKTPEEDHRGAAASPGELLQHTLLQESKNVLIQFISSQIQFWYPNSWISQYWELIWYQPIKNTSSCISFDFPVLNITECRFSASSISSFYFSSSLLKIIVARGGTAQLPEYWFRAEKKLTSGI